MLSIAYIRSFFILFSACFLGTSISFASMDDCFDGSSSLTILSINQVPEVSLTADTQEIITLRRYFSQLPKDETLTFEGQPLDSTDYMNLKKVLMSSGIEAISFNSCSMSPGDVLHVGEIFSRMPCLKHIDMSFTEMSDEGCRVLCEQLSASNRACQEELESIDIEGNQLTVTSFYYLLSLQRDYKSLSITGMPYPGPQTNFSMLKMLR